MLTNEREHRRGLVLGLTLAEVLILLLFLLLLIFGARINELTKETKLLDPLREEVKRDGNLSMRHLVDRLNRTTELERKNSDLQEQLAKLTSELKIVKTLSESSRKAFEQVPAIIERAAKITPDDPPAALRRGLDLVDAVGLRTDIRKLQVLTELSSQLEKLGEQVGSVEKERDQIRRERDNLMRRGRGVEYPSCWTTPEGETEYIFDVTIRDSGVVVRDIVPVSRKADQARKLVDDFPRDTEIAETKFRSATARLNAWSRANECRFFVNLRDETGEHN